MIVLVRGRVIFPAFVVLQQHLSIHGNAMKLLTRDRFRESVFARDNNKCVICGADGQDAHHILERRLFNDGGYYIDNGATLCAQHHIDAEKTIISCDEIRKAAGIRNVVLPAHFYQECKYDKWGNIINPNGTRLKGELFNDESVQKILFDVLDRFTEYVKYPRTYHLPCSPGRTSDDKTLDNYKQFEGKRVVVTVKMDGENTTVYSNGHIHARSIDSKSHPSRSIIKNYLSVVAPDLPAGWRICGENMYAKHSIHYHNLKSYFYMFSIWDDTNTCLPQDITTEFAYILGLSTPKVLYDGVFDSKIIENLYVPEVDGDPCEGFVIRNADAFHYSEFRFNVAKYVRPDHVQTDQHWLSQEIVKNKIENV